MHYNTCDFFFTKKGLIFSRESALRTAGEQLPSMLQTLCTSFSYHRARQ